MDTIVWNKAEKIVEDAEADVLELFDWYGPYSSSQLCAKTAQVATPENWSSEDRLGMGRDLNL